ncbi:PKD domain-containing protein [Kerstersia gyiorum]|jgi:hypothetical protein|uniref:PKD domain-containing protein n=1 Tax=Kerstersia gyiorum TaxID=206506 RepID=UPI00242D29B9|nr:PKD domain-containing protein [Kerstersia gyiorum]MCH4271728.1 PKD domain-containing protein [Kerstersia gyiorum]MCI1227572.1 PKD domain-containing protein [Kerstersia gyiorum]
MKLNKYVMLLGLPLVLAACGGGGGDGDSGERPVTKSPVANAGADQIVPMGTVVQLDGGASAPGTNGNNLRYSWSLPEKPMGSSAVYADAGIVNPSFLADLPGRYTATLTVNDGVVDSASDSVTITATTTVPVAIAEPVQDVALSAEVVLDGSQSVAPSDGDAGALVYRWTLLSKPSGSQAELTDATTAKARFHADVEGEYLALLIVNYGDQVSQPREVLVRAAKGNTAPVANIEVVSIGGKPVEPLTGKNKKYQVERGQEVVFSGSGSTDADGDELSYRWGATSWTQGSEIANKLKGKQAEFRMTPDVAAGDWSVSLQVFDGQLYNQVSALLNVVKPEGAENTPPVARLDPVTTTETYEMELGQLTNISAFSSYDIDGDSLWGKHKLQLLDYPAGFTPPDWSAPIWSTTQFTPTELGDYRVRLISNDGLADSLPVEAVYTAKRGANHKPKASVVVTAATALINQDIKFGCGGSDPDGDELTCEWAVADTPDGSAATLQVLNGGKTASMKADKPGRYVVDLVVVDSEGERSLAVSGGIHVKSVNNPPVYAGLYHYAYGEFSILWTSIANKLVGSHLGTAAQPYLVGQRIDLMPISMSDPDGDKLYPLWTLVEQPKDSKLVEAVDTETLNFTPQYPGRYVYQFITSDGIVKTQPQQVAVEVVKEEDYPGLLLRTHGAYDDPANLYPTRGGVQPQLGWPHDWMNTVAVKQDPASSASSSKAWNAGVLFSMTAHDKDYTVTDMRVLADGDRPELPSFVGLTNGQKIKRGETVYFLVYDPRQASNGTLDPGTEIEWFFRIAEKPEQTFRYRQRYQLY